MDIRAKISLAAGGFKKGAKETKKELKGIGSASDKANKKISDGFTKSEQELKGATKALQDYRRAQTQLAKTKDNTAEASVARGIEDFKRVDEVRKANKQVEKAERDSAVRRENILRKSANRKVKAERQAAKSVATAQLDEIDRVAPRIRYALYDVARNATVAAAALGGFSIAAVNAFSKFESAFTAVERTTQTAGLELQKLREDLIDISTTIPVAFEDVSKIATLGAQMGIANDQLADFTTTVAEFSSITGISVDETSAAFGRLAQLMDVPVSKFNNLSSAIVYAGISAVATDREILTMSESIAASATMAGFSADEVVGLSTALASLKVRPYEARGVFVRLFRTIDLEVSRAGKRMDDFAKVIGVSTEAAQQLYQNDSSEFFQSFLEGAEATGRFNEVMSDLGITNTRELNVLQRLAANTDLLTKSMADANKQYLLGTFSADSYAKVADDFASKVQVLQNTFQALLADLGDEFGEDLKPFIDGLTNLLKAFGDLPTGVKQSIVVLTALTGVLALLTAGGVIFVAGLLALRTALISFAGESGKAGISLGMFNMLIKDTILKLPVVSGLLAANARGMQALAIGTYSASAATRVLSSAMFALGGPIGITIAAVSAVGAAGLALSAMSENAEKAKNRAYELGQSTLQAVGGVEAFASALEKDSEAAEAGEGYISKLTLATKDLAEEAENIEFDLEVASIAAGTAEVIKGTDDVNDALDGMDSAARIAAAGQEILKDATKETNEAVADQEVVVGKNTAALLVEAATKYSKDDGSTGNIFAELFPQGEEDLRKYEELGFDITEAIRAGLDPTTSTQEYVDNFIAGVEDRFTGGFDLEGALMQVPEGYYDPIVREIADVQGSLEEWAAANDGVVQSGLQSTVVADVVDKITSEITDDSEEAASGIEILSEQIQRMVETTFTIESSNQNAASSFRDFREGVEQTGGALFGLSEAAGKNMSNFQSFIEDAYNAAIEDGSGAIGGFARVSSALSSMAQEGLDTGEALEIFKDFAIESFEATGEDYAGLINALNQTNDLSGIRQAINAFYLAKIAAGEASEFSVGFRNEWQQTLAMFDQFAGVGPSFKKSAGTAQTALQKLQASIEDLFSWTNRKLQLEDTLASFGETLRENGKYFSLYSERGRTGIKSILDVIDELAVQSGGDLQKMANYLGAFRQALVDAGVPAAGLRYVDKAIADTGKTANVSSHYVSQFSKSIAGIHSEAKDAERALLKMASAAKEFSSSVSSGLSARFALVDAMDDITLAQLDMADAAEQASEQISNLNDNIDDNNKAIRDAKQAIEDANAEIGKLAADKSTLEYQLNIALKYGDTLRANELRAQIAGIDEEITGQENNITDASQDIRDAQTENKKLRKEISDIQTTNTRETIEESRALRDLALKFATLTGNMLANAEEGADLNKIITDQVEDFKNVAKQMGFNSTEVDNLARLLEEELIVAMDEIPEDISTEITAETAGAMSAINSFVSNATSRLNSIPNNIVTRHTTIESTITGRSANPTHWSTGGFVQGPGGPTSDSIPAMLSNGEYVIKASAVSRYGVDFFNALNQMSRPPAMAAGAGAVAAGIGSQMVYLSPEDRNLLQQAVNRPVTLYADSTTIATTANDGNKILAQRGLN